MTPNRITIHCSASPNGKELDISVIDRIHKQERGFTSVGYHAVIQPDGTRQWGRPLNQIGAHVEGHNKGNLGICLIGTDKYTRAQFDQLRSTLDTIIMTYSIPKTEIYVHHQFDTAFKKGKTCPNIPINVILGWYYQIVGERAIAPFLLK